MKKFDNLGAWCQYGNLSLVIIENNFEAIQMAD